MYAFTFFGSRDNTVRKFATASSRSPMDSYKLPSPMYAGTNLGSPFRALAYASRACVANTSRSATGRLVSAASSALRAAICTQVAGLGSPRDSRLVMVASGDGVDLAALGGGGGESGWATLL